MKAKYCVVFLLVMVLLYSVLPRAAFSSHKQQVLGATTHASDIEFPKISTGPGFILPDSPLFFLDELKQNLRILFALKSSQKALIRMQIAGERMAELRLMLARNNSATIDKTLYLLAREVRGATTHLGNAAARGEKIDELVIQMNTNLKEYKQILAALERQADTELALKLAATRAGVNAAKIEVEDELPTHLLAKEIEDDLAQEIEEKMEYVTKVSYALESALAALSSMANESASRALSNRAQAVRAAIDRKDEELARSEQAVLGAETTKQDLLITTRELASLEALEALQSFREARQEYIKAQSTVSAIQNTPVTDSRFTASPTPSKKPQPPSSNKPSESLSTPQEDK